MAGMIHIYHGDGKGKTTAAIGLAVRAAGAGKKVVFAQFLKSGDSSEMRILRVIPEIRVHTLKMHNGFFSSLTKEEKAVEKENAEKLFLDAWQAANDSAALLVLDEVIPACAYKLISEDNLSALLNKKPADLEVVLTGRNPSHRLLSQADYITEMRKIKHPYDAGIRARHGIEF